MGLDRAKNGPLTVRQKSVQNEHRKKDTPIAVFASTLSDYQGEDNQSDSDSEATCSEPDASESDRLWRDFLNYDLVTKECCIVLLNQSNGKAKVVDKQNNESVL